MDILRNAGFERYRKENACFERYRKQAYRFFNILDHDIVLHCSASRHEVRCLSAYERRAALVMLRQEKKFQKTTCSLLCCFVLDSMSATESHGIARHQPLCEGCRQVPLSA